MKTGKYDVLSLNKTKVIGNTTLRITDFVNNKIKITVNGVSFTKGYGERIPGGAYGLDDVYFIDIMVIHPETYKVDIYIVYDTVPLVEPPPEQPGGTSELFSTKNIMYAIAAAIGLAILIRVMKK